MELCPGGFLVMWWQLSIWCRTREYREQLPRRGADFGGVAAAAIAEAAVAAAAAAAALDAAAAVVQPMFLLLLLLLRRLYTGVPTCGEATLSK